MMATVLLVEDKESLGRMLEEALAVEDFSIEWVTTGTEAIRRLAHKGGGYLAVVTDLRLPGKDGIEVLQAAREADPDVQVIVMTGYGTIEDAVKAMKLGAYDFIQKPIDVDHLLLLLRRCRDLRALRFENLLLKEEFQKRRNFPMIIAESPQIEAVSREIQKAAPTDSTVLLLGESGTGKELFARAVHELSGRRDRPFVAINCAAIPETLLENELFGHEKGAYTGAVGRQIGKFELANDGTVFLDEIGELGLSVQSKILRVLQERNFERISGLSTVEVDVRIICATNRDLERAVKEGKFREDLYYRIHVFPVTIPPLRARKDDIDPLVDFFVDKFGREMGKKGTTISVDARRILGEYDWPGNVRELENCLERAIILCERNEITSRDLSVEPSRARSDEVLREAFDVSGTLAEAADRATAAVERIKIAEALRSSPSRNAAADVLGVSYRTLLAKMKEHGLDKEEMRKG
jgi:DNA-binding NtrC family response regulator